MKKNISSLFSMLLVAAVVIASCSKESVAPQKAKGYKINIQATNGSSTKVVTESEGKGVTTFLNTENIFVCNLSDGKKIDATPINPTPDALDAHNARIVGNLSGETTSSVAITYAVGNSLRLLYNTPANGVVDYTAQDGTLANTVGAAVADVSIVGIGAENEITASHANFNNLQNIFKFQFKNGGVGDPLTVKYLRISSAGNKLQYQYNAVTGTGSYGPVDVTNAGGLTTVYVALRFDAVAGDPIVFEVVDSDGKVYTGTKNAPASTGFANSKFYTSTISVTPHVFTVASGKSVYFAPGNMVKRGSDYYFARDYFLKIGYGSADPATADPTSYFCWSAISNSTKENKNDPKPLLIVGVNDWKTPIYNEMNYLLNTRSMTGGLKRFYLVSKDNNYTSGVGLLIPPDNATYNTGLSADGFSTDINITTFIGKGFVFLPAEGHYRGSSWGIEDIPYDHNIVGFYWCSTWGSSSITNFLHLFYNVTNDFYALNKPIVEFRQHEMSSYCSVRPYHD